MSEHFTLFFLVLLSSAGILLASRLASSGFRYLWKRLKSNLRKPVSPPALIEKQTTALTDAVRGYDTPELFYCDTIIRIRDLQRQIIRLRPGV